MLVSCTRRRLTKSTLLDGRRSAASCGNAAPHSGECKIHGKDVLQRLEAWPHAAHLVASLARPQLARSGPLANPSSDC
jgi:hypothetical protein